MTPSPPSRPEPCPACGHVSCPSLSDGFRWLDRFLDVEEPPAVCRHLVPDDGTGLERPCRCAHPVHAVGSDARALATPRDLRTRVRLTGPRRSTLGR